MELVIEYATGRRVSLRCGTMEGASKIWRNLREANDLQVEDVRSVTLHEDLQRIGSVGWCGTVWTVVDHAAGFASSEAEVLYTPAEEIARHA